MKKYIKREDAVKAIRTIKSCIKLFEASVEETAVAVDTYAQAADVEKVRHGRWEKVRVNPAAIEFCCSECGHQSVLGWDNYCSNCGARMDGGADNAAD